MHRFTDSNPAAAPTSTIIFPYTAIKKHKSCKYDILGYKTKNVIKQITYTFHFKDLLCKVSHFCESNLIVNCIRKTDVRQYEHIGKQKQLHCTAKKYCQFHSVIWLSRVSSRFKPRKYSSTNIFTFSSYFGLSGCNGKCLGRILNLKSNFFFSIY